MDSEEITLSAETFRKAIAEAYEAGFNAGWDDASFKCGDCEECNA